MPQCNTKTRGLLPIVLVLILLQVACEMGASHSAVYNDLLLRVQTNSTRAEVGKPIQVRFTITNTGINKHTYILESSTTPVMDIVVDVVGGPELLAWSAQNPDKVQHRIEWKPGESKTIELIWIPKPEDIASGYYKDIFLTGLLYTDGKIVQDAGVTVCASNYCK